MAQQRHRPWKMYLRAKAKSMDFKLKSSLVCKLLIPFSIRFKLHPSSYILEIRSKPEGSSLLFKIKSLKPLRIFKNRGIVVESSWFAHNKNNIFCFYGRRRRRRRRRRRTSRIRIWLRFLVFALIIMLCSCFLIIIIMRRLRFYFGGGGFIYWKYFWKACYYYAVPPGILKMFAKVIFNGICQSMGFSNRV